MNQSQDNRYSNYQKLRNTAARTKRRQAAEPISGITQRRATEAEPNILHFVWQIERMNLTTPLKTGRMILQCTEA